MDSDKQSTGYTLGVLLVILGIIILATQVLTTLVSVFLLGLALVVGGILEIGRGLSGDERRSNFSGILGGVINLVLGGIMIFFPTLSAITLTLIIAIAMIVLGVYRLAISYSNRVTSRGWSLFGGALTLLLGVLLLIGWPSTGLYIIGLFLGIQLLISGIATLLIGTPTEVRIERETSFAHDIKKDRSKEKKD